METDRKSIGNSSNEKVHESKESHSAVGHSGLESHDWDPEFEKKTMYGVVDFHVLLSLLRPFSRSAARWIGECCPSSVFSMPFPSSTERTRVLPGQQEWNWTWCAARKIEASAVANPNISAWTSESVTPLHCACTSSRTFFCEPPFFFF